MVILKRIASVFLSLLLFAGIVGCGASDKDNSGPNVNNGQQAQTQDNAKNEYFVDSDWLKDNLDSVILLDARDQKSYDAGHITGALNTTWQTFSDMDGKPGEPEWGTLLTGKELAEKIGSLGIDGTKTVVVYADPAGWGEDGRVAWTLRMAALTDVKMLDGGWSAWQASGYETTKEAPAVTAVEFNISAMNAGLNATTDWIVNNSESIKIVDSRAPKEYAGATDFGEARGGHLPKAINIPFGDTFNADGTVKSSQELKDLFTNAGLLPDDEIVVYCTKGIRSAHMTLLLRMAGFDKARNYDASFYTWAGDASLGMEK
ncbi:MAG: sulfurtransferase [Bacillota bacterium]